MQRAAALSLFLGPSERHVSCCRKRACFRLEAPMHRILVLATLLLIHASQLRAEALDTARIEVLTGAKGKLDAGEGVFKVSVPRSDLAVSVGGVKLVPASGLTSWAAFTPMSSGVMVMGDLVLTEIGRAH